MRKIRHMGNKGVTLIEVFVAIVIAGILVGLGIPSLLPLIRSSKIDGATRQVMYEIRAVQNLAVTRGTIFGFHWGADPLVGMADSVYRIESNQTGNCVDWPLPADTMATNADVIRDWFDLAGEYQGVTMPSVKDNVGTALGGVMFNSRGASVNNCAIPAPTFPVWVCLSDAAGTLRAIQIQRAGRVTIVPPPAGVCP
ncbi:MAG: Tfp pilus assembly protein FimT/FimU [Candidatus Methylomirabilales bacterium]